MPPIGVDARSEHDIQAAIKFIKQYNLKLVVKNTGHDYLGRSTARGGFLLWTHNMKQLSYNSTFLPDGAPATADNTFNGDFLFPFLHFQGSDYEHYLSYISAITVGAGTQWHDAYDFAQKQGRVIVGAGSASVGAAGGWVMGGGHSPLSPKFGLGTPVLSPIIILMLKKSLSRRR